MFPIAAIRFGIAVPKDPRKPPKSPGFDPHEPGEDGFSAQDVCAAHLLGGALIDLFRGRRIAELALETGSGYVGIADEGDRTNNNLKRVKRELVADLCEGLAATISVKRLKPKLPQVQKDYVIRTIFNGHPLLVDSDIKLAQKSLCGLNETCGHLAAVATFKSKKQKTIPNLMDNFETKFPLPFLSHVYDLTERLLKRIPDDKFIAMVQEFAWRGKLKGKEVAHFLYPNVPSELCHDAKNQINRLADRLKPWSRAG